MHIIQIAEWTVDFGGEEHTGWLPEGAALPSPTPVIRADLALAILQQGPDDYILEWRGPTQETSGDTQHSSLVEAIAEAERWFGVPNDAWTKIAAS